MLINSLRFYERILLGLASSDEEVQAFAVCCLSYLVPNIRMAQLNLPENVVAMLEELPQ